MEKRIINKVYLDQFLKDFEVYYNNLGKVSQEISHALFSNKCYTFENVVKDYTVGSELQNIVENTWIITHDEDTIIAILQKLDCEVI